MPYIAESRRKQLDDQISELINKMITLDQDSLVRLSPGDLNYIFTKLAIGFSNSKGISYQTFNDVLGALEGAKLELYRRLIAGYEDYKAKQNGDVY